MAQLFELTLWDGSDAVDFLDGSNYEVLDGGFDIGLPSSSKNYVSHRAGPFFEASSIAYGPRDARIRISVFGATRSAVIGNINAIQKILHNAEARKKYYIGGRVELQYAWEGANDLTYFEVLGGEVLLPPDVLSVGKMHVKQGGIFYVPEIEVQLDLGPFGYGLSLYTSPGASFEVPLYNPNVGSAQTGGILVENPFLGNYNYVEISNTDVQGEQPFITKIVVNGVNATSTYSTWNQLFIGHKLSPFPTDANLLLEGESRTGSTGITWSNPAGGSNNFHAAASVTTTTNPYFEDTFGAMYWGISSENTRGLFQAFIQGYDTPYSLYSHFAVGLADYTYQGHRFISDWYSPRNTTQYHLPLGTVQVPAEDKLVDLGIAFTSYVTLFYGQDSGQASIPVQIDFLSLMPINDGYRIWLNRGVSSSNLEGNLIDDAWLGAIYLQRNDNSNLTAPLIGMLNPIKLEPDITQRLYFTSLGVSNGTAEGARSYRVRVYAVPTYKLLAL